MPEKTSSPLVDSIVARIKSSEADEETLQAAAALLPSCAEIRERLLIEQGRRLGMREAIEEIQLYDAF